MKLVDPKYQDLTYSYTNPLLLGERCARVCYKSEDLIKEGSARKILEGIGKAGHTAMFEHIPVYLKCYKSMLDAINYKDDFDTFGHIMKSPYSKTREDDTTWYVSTNLRVVFENNRYMYEEFMDNLSKGNTRFKYTSKLNIDNCICEDSPYFFARYTILFDMDRIGSQSFCRHRVFSFAQESTRWCNFLKEKFGKEISISTPCWLKKKHLRKFKRHMRIIEWMYFKWQKLGYTGEQARYFLPFGLHTQIIMTGFIDAWTNFFILRNDSHAHVQARELARELEEHFIEFGYLPKDWRETSDSLPSQPVG